MEDDVRLSVQWGFLARRVNCSHFKHQIKQEQEVGKTEAVYLLVFVFISVSYFLFLYFLFFSQTRVSLFEL